MISDLGIELAMLEQKNPSKNIGAVVGIAEKLSLMQDSVPQIKEQKYILDKVQTNEFWEKAFILEMDAVREALRDLIQFLPKKTQRIVYTDFADQIIEYQENTPIEMGNRLENYRKKVEFYLKEHQDNMAVHKLRNNQKSKTFLCPFQDLANLCKVLFLFRSSDKILL